MKSKDGSKRSRKKPTVTDAGEDQDAVKEEKSKVRTKKTKEERALEKEQTKAAVEAELQGLQEISLTDTSAALYMASVDAEKNAFLGLTYADLADPNEVYMSFGLWNDRPLEMSKARQMADSFRPEPRRLSMPDMIKVPVSIGREISQDAVKEVMKWRDTSKLQAKKFATEGWKSLRELLMPRAKSVSPVGGQHRKEAMKILIDMYRAEMMKEGEQLVKARNLKNELEEIIAALAKEGQSTSGQQVRLGEVANEIESLEGVIRVKKAVLKDSGRWLIGLYDASEWPSGERFDCETWAI